MTQEQANKLFNSPLGQQLDVIYSTSDDRVFIRYEEAISHTQGMLDGGSKPLENTEVLPWYQTN